MLVCIIKQPWCVIATDSSQVRTLDFENPAATVYRNDAEKLHISDKLVLAEGGNPQVFAAFKRRLLLESKGSIEGALKKAPTLMNRSARAWETEMKFKRPKTDASVMHGARNTRAILAGWSERKKKILAGTVTDEQSLNSLAPENGFLVQYHYLETKKKIDEYMKSVLFGPNKGFVSRDSMMEHCRTALRTAAEIENARLGTHVFGGPIRLVVIDGAAAPKIIAQPENVIS